MLSLLIILPWCPAPVLVSFHLHHIANNCMLLSQQVKLTSQHYTWLQSNIPCMTLNLLMLKCLFGSKKTCQLSVTLAKCSAFITPLLLSPRRSIICAVPARYSGSVSGPEWQPTSLRHATGLPTNQSASSICAPHCPIGTGCSSTTAGDCREAGKFPICHFRLSADD